MREKLRHVAKKVRLKRASPEESLKEAISNLPRITNDTVAEHREEVLSSARKYIYPLKHSQHRVVIISVSLLAVITLAFMTYCVLALYKFQSTSMFMYRVTQIIPFPIAKAGTKYVSYENYLFELRHYMHYYETQQRIDFSDESGKQQLEATRKQVLDGVVKDAYIKQLAEKNGISVSDREVSDAINLVRSQNKLGSSDKVYEDVLKDFWGWSTSDFKRSLRQQLLAQKVVATLDKETRSRANEAYAKVKSGGDFAALATQYSDDPITKQNGGSYGFDITESSRDLPPQVIDAIFKLKAGETSGVINAGSSLEIVKVTSISGAKVQASHISFNFKPIGDYVGPLEQKNKPRLFISSN